MIRRFSKGALLASVAAALATPVTPAFAEDINEEIIVQARKRDESIMNVPVVASVIGAAKLDQYAVGGVEDIADKVTGLNYQSGNNASGTLVSLRGVGTNSNNPAVDQSVALVVDGQQFTQGLAFRAATFDMARVEVLKGPQALFFGKAAPGGVISIRTADPGDRLELLGRAGYEFEAQKQVYEAVVSGPVSSTLGLRLAAQYSDANGYFHNLSNPVAGPFAFGALAPVNKRTNNNETFILRGTAVWNPVDTFSARLKFNYVRDEIQGWGSMGQMVSCPEGTAPRLPIPYAAIAGDDCKLDRNYYGPDVKQASFGDGTLQNNGVEFNLSEQYFGSLELNYDISPTLSLTSLSTYYDVAQKSLGNVTISSNVGPVFMLDGTWDRKDFTQELRLTSDLSGPFNFMLGGFYQKADLTYAFDLPVNKELIAFGIPLPTSLGQFKSDIAIDTYSLFGQGLFKITPQLELGFGARWTSEKRGIVPTLVTGPSYSPAGIVLPIVTNRLSANNWSPELSLTYRPNDNLTVFFNLKQAYKSGSFDVGGTISPNTNISFGDERVRGGELGLKSRMLDGALRFNIAGYYQNFKDMQVKAGSVVSNGGIAVRTLNAASAEIYGIDMDFSYSPPQAKGLSIYGGVNWNLAKYKDFAVAPCWWGQLASEGCNQLLDVTTGRFSAQNLKGQRLLRAPEWTANAGFDYEAPISDSLKFRFGGNLAYSSSYSTTIENYYFQEGYAKLGATLGIGSQNGRWMVELIGDNLTDKLTVGSCFVEPVADSIVLARSANRNGAATRGPTGVGEVMCAPNPGRSLFLRLTVRN